MPSLCDILKGNKAKRNGGVLPVNGWKRAAASVFWVGEYASEDNGFIHNHASAWDPQWEKHHGGSEDPEAPVFTPLENPFYVALPYNDIAKDGTRKPESYNIPWFPVGGVSPPRSILKNRWVEVRCRQFVAYGQWEDVGPFGEDDWDYVFGAAQDPKNTVQLGAGIDVSPRMAQELHFDGTARVEWRFVAAHEVPDGPWRDIITTREGPAWAR